MEASERTRRGHHFGDRTKRSHNLTVRPLPTGRSTIPSLSMPSVDPQYKPPRRLGIKHHAATYRTQDAEMAGPPDIPHQFALALYLTPLSDLPLTRRAVSNPTRPRRTIRVWMRVR